MSVRAYVRISVLTVNIKENAPKTAESDDLSLENPCDCIFCQWRRILLPAQSCFFYLLFLAAAAATVVVVVVVVVVVFVVFVVVVVVVLAIVVVMDTVTVPVARS